MEECNHNYASLIGEDMRTLPVSVCLKCGALKIGNSILVTADYIALPTLTADPTGAEGRFAYRADLDKCRYHNGAEWKSL